MAFSQDKMKGHFWDLNGEKHIGKLKMVFSSVNGPGTIIKFYQKGEKMKKIGKGVMNSFVWDTDSFTLIKNFQVTGFGNNYKSDFAQVVSTGKINLYRHWRKKHSEGPVYTPIGILTSVYIIQKPDKAYYIGIYNKNQFEKELLPLIKDNKQLYEKVNNMPKMEWMRNISIIIKEYNE